MAKYRKRLVEIEAYRFENKVGEDTRPSWILEAVDRGDIYYQGGDAPYLTIKALGGDVRCELGDWVIMGVQGELYSCKPAIFEATYEVVEE